MIRDWRLRKKIAFGAAGLLLFNAVIGISLSRQVARQLRTTLPPGSTVGDVRWSPPFGVVLDKLSIPDSTKNNPFLLQADRVVLQIPWWGLLVRPIPARVTAFRPYLKIGPGNLGQLMGDMEADPDDWILSPFLGAGQKNAASGENPILGKIPFVPFEIKVINGRVEAIDREIRAEAPVFTADHVELSLELTAAMIEPTIQLVSKGDFVTESGELIGNQEVDIRCRPLKKAMEGSFRLRHERLQDFRNLYQYAPRPIFMEGGIADFTMQFALTGGDHLKLTARTLVQNLDLVGKVGEVSWAEIMHAIEEENRIYEWTVTVEGDLSNPAFNPHDNVLDEVEWKMKEKAASRGLKIPDQMFFYADTPGVDE